MSAATLPHFKLNYGQVSLGKEAGIMTQDYSQLYDLLPEHNSLNLQTATAQKIFFKARDMTVFYSLEIPSNSFCICPMHFFRMPLRKLSALNIYNLNVMF